MEGVVREFEVCYKSLLGSITGKLGWDKPDYFERPGLGNVAAVLVRPKDGGDLANYFDGGVCHDIVRSKNAAAKEAVLFLVDRERLYVMDYNLRKSEAEACMAYYKAKMGMINNSVRNVGDNGDVGYAGSVNIDFCLLLRTVLESYGISSTQLEFGRFSRSEHVYFYGVRYPPGELEWFMGRVSAIKALAKQSMAKKVLRFLQPLLGFVFLDFSYHRMVLAQQRCTEAREEYLAAKDASICVQELSSPVTQSVVDGFSTPQNIESQIHTPTSPSPTPKKRRLASNSGLGETSDGVTGVCLYQLPDDLSTVFPISGAI